MSLQSLIASGTKVWLDSVHPDEVKKNRACAYRSYHNPIIISDIIKAGGYDKQLQEFGDKGMDNDASAWALNDRLVKAAQDVFLRFTSRRRVMTVMSALRLTRCWRM